MVGEVLGDRYELEELVGAGGMSSVFRAHDRLLDRKVALKVLHQQYADDPEYVERFRREARAVATLSHPNVVTVIDRGDEDGRQFIVFEYVDGENLKRLLEREGPLPVERALELAMQVARGLSFAHQEGLVHRDVKPQNVLLNGDGRAKVTDFGIARSLDVQQGVTRTGTVLGTSDYIAPEQAQGQAVDEQSDVYSLGVVLYELLTGKVPFPGENFVAVAMRHINEPPPSVRASRPEVPPRVDAAVQRAMAKSPADRFPTMLDFCAELDACLDELQGTQVLRPQAAPRVSRRRKRAGWGPWPAVLVLAALVATGAVVYVLIHGTNVGSLGRHSGGGGGGAPRAVPLHGVGAYDPFGDNHTENDQQAGLATDGKTSTGWTTEQYYDAPSLDKPGVGLVLDAGAPVTLHQLGIATATPGFTAVIRAGDTSRGPFPVVASSPGVVQRNGTSFTIASSAGRHRYWLVWITRLGAGFQTAQVNEVRAD